MVWLCRYSHGSPKVQGLEEGFLAQFDTDVVKRSPRHLKVAGVCIRVLLLGLFLPNVDSALPLPANHGNHTRALSRARALFA